MVFSRGTLSQSQTNCTARQILKGLGHTVLGKFSTDHIIIELTKVSK